MNNQHHQGPGPPQSGAYSHQSRRQQEYHHYQQHGPPQSPGPYNPYATPYPSHYYGHPMQMPYQMPRWAPPQSYNPYQVPPHMHNGPRSPMVVGSQSHMLHMPPNTRPPPYAHPPAPSPSPYSVPSANTSYVSQAASSPRESPSKTSTPRPTSRRSSSVAHTQPASRIPFYPQLPWYSPNTVRESFPPRSIRRRKRRNLESVSNCVSLPSRLGNGPEGDVDEEAVTPKNQTVPAPDSAQPNDVTSHHLLEETPPNSKETIHSEIAQHTTNLPDQASLSTGADTARKPADRVAVPIIPALPQIARPRATSATKSPHPDALVQTAEGQTDEGSRQHQTAEENVADLTSPTSPTPAVPKSWADLVRAKGAAKTEPAPTNGAVTTNGSSKTRNGSIGEIFSHFEVSSEHKLAFLEPRGLVNTGNMCYMNSILQVLVYCIPFYDLLDQVGKRAAHSFKSDTPLVDAMIMFMGEFKIIDSAESEDKLRMRLKNDELEQYGDSLIPEYVYSAINRLPRFSSMRRGHQQDAEEFLGFLLEGLHDECIAVMKSQGIVQPSSSEAPTSPISTASQNGDGWLEVGPKQRAAITRQSGDPSSSTPVTRIFGGTLRSELRVPGMKNSVTLEPYQPLQLDIGASNINNIVDALKGLTKPESLTGDFNSPRGPGTSATKQVFIETLPPVLILHLKRFQYDSSGGTQKIWKRIGYPLELELPREVFAPSKRGGLAAKGGLPRYRLNAVVYHHGKSAAGGHYTVDLLRQDRREWIRVDDTFIRRVRADDVAEGGADEDPKALAKALEIHQAQQEVPKRNPYEGLDGEEKADDDGKVWNDVNGAEAKKKWAGIAASAGTATPGAAGKATPRREGVKDNKIAYILMYERMSL